MKRLYAKKITVASNTRPQAQKAGRSTLTTLRLHNPGVGHNLRTSIHRELSILFSSLAMFLFPVRKRHAMCENYGHEIDHRSWGMGSPRCRDCNKEITSSTDLRTSNLKA